ncbi:DegV family protein [Lentilactobacillus sp. Marseille-Q4993]|uniref:DegV family protein n=1 Tax=Lentilactobacillus sp. Marseille-Q4993 TaxID=3039492 RepID=UPI0024BC1523|nr:DegV family protein [Lentilactobacillus sp. Marseille-Q4993]
MNPKIGLLVDSATDIPTEVAMEENVEIVPLMVTAEGNDYLDRETIEPIEVYEMMNNGVIPTTASPTIALVSKSIERLKAKGYHNIIGVTISSGLSVTNSVFKQAADLDESVKVNVIDTKNIGIGARLIATFAEELISDGVDFDDVVDRVTESVLRSRVYFYVPSLKYLRAGGRIGRVAGILGSALKIKPIISCNSEGIYYPIDKERSEKKALKKLVDLAITHAKAAPSFRIGVAHGHNEALSEQVVDDIKKIFPDHKVFRGDVSPALGVHTGPGLIGIAVQID